MTIRQTAGETVDQYSRRFSKLLRKCNNNNLVLAALQVRMYLYGLQPLLTPLVSMHNPGDLAAAIVRAKAVETGYNYVPNKALTVQVPPTVVGNPSMPIIATPTIKETTPTIFTTPKMQNQKLMP